MITVDFKCIKGNDITAERVLAGFSPCFVEWSDSSIVGNKVGKLTASVVGGGSHTFENLIPNADGKFHFDLSMIAKPYLLMCKTTRAMEFDVYDAFVNDRNSMLTFGDIVDIKFEFGINTTESGEFYLSFSRTALQLNQTNRASMIDYTSNMPTDEVPASTTILYHSPNIRRWDGYPLNVSFMAQKIDVTKDVWISSANLYFNGVQVGTSGLEFKDGKNAVVGSFAMYSYYNDFVELELRTNVQTTGEDDINTVAVFYQHFTKGECGNYIRWRNSLSGWSYWLFDANASHTEQVSNRDNVLEVFTTDPYLESTKRMLERSKVEQTTLATSTSFDWEVKHLSDLNTSTEVYLYKLPKGVTPQGEPEEWEQVKVVNLTYDPTTDRTPVKSYRLTIEKIDTITQSC